MRFSTVLAALLPAGAAMAQTTHTVMVGWNDTHTFMPNSLNATQGDMVQFQFLTGNHTVTQSSFTAPCTELAAATTPFDSGFMPANATANNGMVPSVTFQVTNTSAPLWFFCKQTGHCEQGMVFAINANANKTFNAFQAAANATQTNTSSSNSGSSGSSSASMSGTATAGGSTPSASTAGKTSGALKIGGSAAGLLTAVGLVAGLLL